MADFGAPQLGFRVYAKIYRAGESALALLADASVGDVCDAMHGTGVIDSGIAGIYAPMRRVFGSAVTVDLTPGDGLLMRPAIDAAQPGDVLVVNAHGVTARAVLGGMVGMHMVRRGIAGLIVDGAVRDVAEFRELGLPVMARAVTPRSGSSDAGWGEVNVPVACGGAVVHPGDVMIGDAEGIVVVPRIWAEAVAKSLGATGHPRFQPEGIRNRLKQLDSAAPSPWAEKMQRLFSERKAHVIQGHYDDWKAAASFSDNSKAS
jgi:4-hydroxy-4-methyl-2-oxoglutarate aldolase